MDKEPDIYHAKGTVLNMVVSIDRHTGKEISRKITGPSKITPDEYLDRVILAITRSSTIEEACNKFRKYMHDKENDTARSVDNEKTSQEHRPD